MLVGAVAFLDALGFKGIWKRHANSEQAVLDKLANLEARLAEVGNGIAKKFPEDAAALGASLPAKLHVRTLFVSDSIFITAGLQGSQGPAVDTMCVGIVASLAALAMFLGTEGIVPLAYRGAISFGRYLVHQDRSFVVGPAVDEAAQAEAFAQGAFVWLTPSARDAIERLPTPVPPPHLVEYDIPLKGLGSFSTYSVNPLKTNFFSPSDKQVFLAQLTRAMDSPSLDVVLKQDNTLFFYEETSDASNETRFYWSEKSPLYHDPWCDRLPFVAKKNLRGGVHPPEGKKKHACRRGTARPAKISTGQV